MPEQEKLSRESAAVQYKLATIWQAKGHVERAIVGYEEAIRLRPDYVPAHLELGQLILQHGTLEEAAAVYRRAIELNPHEVRLQQRLIELSARRGAQAEAPGEAADSTRPASDESGSNRRHIVLFTDCSGINGAEQCNHTLLMKLVEAGYRVTCVQGKGSHHLIEERDRRGIRHVWREDDDLYDLTRPARALLDDAEPRRILRAMRPDLLIFSDGAPMSNLRAKQIAHQLAIPYLVIVHCVAAVWAEQYAPFLDQLPAIYRRAEAVIAVSHANLHLLRERFGLSGDQGQVIHNGRPARFFAPPNPVTRHRLRRELGIPVEAVLVCTVASMEMRKGHRFLLKAMKKLRDSAVWSQLYFAWVGVGRLEPQLRAAVEQLGAQDHVRFLGERSDVADVLAAADIFALTSYYEGMPLSVMEAMARGMPVAATGVSGVPEALGDTGKLLPDPLLDAQAVVNELGATLDAWAIDPSLREAVGLASRRRAAALFTEDRMGEEYLHLVARAIRATPRPQDVSPRF